MPKQEDAYQNTLLKKNFTYMNSRKHPFLIFFFSVIYVMQMVCAQSLAFEVDGVIYDLDKMDEPMMGETRLIDGKTIPFIGYEVDRILISIANKPADWNTEKALELWSKSLADLMEENGLTIQSIEEPCAFPCIDMVSETVDNGGSFYWRTLIVDDRIIEFGIVCQSSTDYPKYKTIFDSFGK